LDIPIYQHLEKPLQWRNETASNPAGAALNFHPFEAAQSTGASGITETLCLA
jgi:hypothetical protein